MKKIKYLFFGIFLNFIIINGVNAAELKVSSITKEVTAGDNINIKLELDTFGESILIDYCDVKIEISEEIELGEIQALNSWTIINKNISSNVINMSVKNHQNKLVGKVNIVDLQYLVSNAGDIKITNASCYQKDGSKLNNVDYDDSLLTINTVVPTAASLKSLSINNYELNPYFSPNVRSYSVKNFNSNYLSLDYELTDLSYSDMVHVLVNGNEVNDLENIPFQLNEDNKVMLITINIGKESSYNIFVSKTGSILYDDYLSSITVNGEQIELLPGKYDYEYIVSDEVTSALVEAELSDSDSFTFGPSSNAPSKFNMPGKAVAVLNVVPQNSQDGIPSATYTVTIINESYVSGVDNPDTDDTSMIIIAAILVVSLIASTVLYKKNINGYR